MAKNIPGALFISKGIRYVLDYDPKGNLRPYTVRLIKTSGHCQRCHFDTVNGYTLPYFFPKTSHP
jgi:hypothetical protein